MADVVCVGILVADVIARPVASYPGRGELSLVEAISPFIGGCAANTGIGLQKLGVPTRIVGKVGPDGFGDFVRTTLSQEGLEVSGVVTDAVTPTSATMVLVAPDGERSFIHSIGANAAFVAADIDWSLFEGAKIVHIAGHFLLPSFDGAPCAEVLQQAREKGLKTALDTAGAPRADWPEVLKPVLPLIDYFVPSYHEALRCVPAGVEATPEAVAAYFLEQGVGVVALKMGEAGSYVTDGKETYTVPPFKVNAKDATGAGDAFAAGFIAAVAKGYSLKEAAELGNAVGALCVTEVGTVAGIKSLEETQAFIKSQRSA